MQDIYNTALPSTVAVKLCDTTLKTQGVIFTLLCWEIKHGWKHSKREWEIISISELP